jgi:hypothetical protein
LADREITNAAPFEAVLKALQAAWIAQEKKLQALHQAQETQKNQAEQKDQEDQKNQKNQENQALQTEQRRLLAEKIATGIRSLVGIEQVPAKVMDFAAGPWAKVVAQAQITDINKDVGKDMDDPGGYVAVVSDLFWSVQPDLVRADPARLKALIPGMLETLRTGLQSIDYPQTSSSAFFACLMGLHRALLVTPEKRPTPQTPQRPAPPPEICAAPPVAAPPVAPTPVDAASAPLPPEVETLETQFVIGAWVELTSNHRKVRTQLTWASPHHTLFLFTAADGSTQSMTRRMRDKLAAEGTLRIIDAFNDAAKTRPRSNKPPKST